MIHLLVHLQAAAAPASYSDQPWLNTGDNAWQLTAATFVALMSVPGLAVLFGGLVQKKWVVNTMFMTFAGFAAVLHRLGVVGVQHGFRRRLVPRAPTPTTNGGRRHIRTSSITSWVNRPRR